MVAGLLVGELRFALPAVVAQARLIGGASGWLWGLQALATVYLAPVLLALIFGAALGAEIVVPGLANPWPAVTRGALVAIYSLGGWLLLLTLLARSLAGAWPVGSSEAPPQAFEAAGYLLLPIAFLVVGSLGGGAGFLLHARAPKGTGPIPSADPCVRAVDLRRVP